jgi:hypothetical protein
MPRRPRHDSGSAAHFGRLAEPLRMSACTAAKTATYLVRNPAGAVLGTWDDAPPPRFRWGADGVDALTVDLPRAYGAFDAPGEAGSVGTVAHGNTVEVWISDAAAAALSPAAAAAGAIVAGSLRAGRTYGGSALVWAGTISVIEPSPPAGVRVTALPWSRLAQQAPVRDPGPYQGDPAQIARLIVERNAPGLAWDVRNPALAGELVEGVSLARAMVDEALLRLRDLCGPDWVLTYTPRRTVRLYPADRTAATHVLVDGITAAGSRLLSTAQALAREVIVDYEGGEVSARAADYDAADPRSARVSGGGITDAGTAGRLARLELAARNRVVLRGTTTVADGPYDIESLAVGDTVRLRVPRCAPGDVAAPLAGYLAAGQITAGAGGYYDYDQPLLIAGIDYQYTRATIELEQPQPGAQRLIGRLLREVEALKRQVAGG